MELSLVVDPATLHPNPVHRALVLIKRLRECGIPAVGAIALENVEHGTLSITAPDLLTGEVRYSWTDSTLQERRDASTLSPG